MISDRLVPTYHTILECTCNTIRIQFFEFKFSLSGGFVMAKLRHVIEYKHNKIVDLYT